MTIHTTLTLDDDWVKAKNLTDKFGKDELEEIGRVAVDGYNRDKTSRSKWEQRTDAAMNLAMQIQQGKSWPWQGCSDVTFPLVTIAALQFSSRAYQQLVQGTEIVKYRVIGPASKETVDRAERIGRHMSWQVLEEDAGWEEETDRGLLNVSIVGTNFKKTFYSGSKGYTTTEMILARDFVLDYYARSVEDCARKTQVMYLYPNEVHERIMRGIWHDVREESWYTTVPTITDTQPTVDVRKGTNPPQPDANTPRRYLEQHCWWDFDGDGYAEPYIITCDETSQFPVRIVARVLRKEDIERNDKGEVICIHATEYFTKCPFIPSPDGGVYDVGFGVLLGPLNEAVNSGINQLIDAGTLSNSLGGLLGRGAKMRSGTYAMAPWEWKRVDSAGDDIRKNIFPWPVREPSDVLFKLLGMLIEYTDRVSGSTDVTVGENPGQNTPAQTYHGMTEAGMKIYSVIFKRIWRSLKEEFKKRHKMNAHYLEPTRMYGEGFQISKEDYLMNPEHVVPTADPNVTSDAARVMQATTLRQAAHTVPGYDIAEVERRFIRALRVDGVDTVYPGPDKTGPLPNPKVQVEQLKGEIKKMQLEHEKNMHIMDLMHERKETEARVLKLHAEAAKLAKETNAIDAGHQLQALELSIDALEKHNKAINERIQALNGGGDGDKNQQGGMGGLEAAPGDGGVPSVPAGVPARANGAMGAGNLPV